MKSLPMNYKLLDTDLWHGCSGKLAGSSQPGYNIQSSGYSIQLKDSAILASLENGVSIEESGLDKGILLELDALHKQGVRVIYSLCKGSEHGDNEDRDPALLKYLWEHKYSDTNYVTRIKEIDTAIEDGEAPSTEQIKAISDDALNKMREGQHIMVHCGLGVGRTGIILAAIHMKATNQYQANDVIRHIQESYNPLSFETEIQQKCISDFAKTCQKETLFVDRVQRNNKTIDKFKPEQRKRLITMLATNPSKDNDKMLEQVYNTINKPLR